MKIAIGSDHGGYDLKEQVKTWLQEMGHEVEDFGCYSKESCDYPDFGAAAAGRWPRVNVRRALSSAPQVLVSL